MSPGLRGMTSWMIPECLMKPHKWRSINLGASLPCSFCFCLWTKPLRFTQERPRTESRASLNLLGFSVSFINSTTLGITWLFILSWKLSQIKRCAGARHGETSLLLASECRPGKLLPLLWVFLTTSDPAAQKSHKCVLRNSVQAQVDNLASFRLLFIHAINSAQLNNSGNT
jgi:hypothetical protein